MVLFDPYKNLVKLEEPIPFVYFIGEEHIFLWGKRDLRDYSIQCPYFAVEETVPELKIRIFCRHSLICVGWRGR